ncbi:MAG: hypothetical protein Q9166_002111 [cf. Caloplaca sp. 2 TL-2023]
MVRTFLHVAIPMHSSPQTPVAKHVGFPFQRLPVELQLMILRYAMPQHGLLPQPLSDLTKHVDWGNGRYSDLLIEYNEYLQTKDWSDAIIPFSLFQVNKFIATEARAIFFNEVYLVINIQGHRMHFLTTIVHGMKFESHLRYSDNEHFQRMQNFQLNIAENPWLYCVKYGPPHDFNYGLDLVESANRVLKERIRTVCDILATNANIQKNSVRLYCLCNCLKVDTSLSGESALLDLLAPLKRIHVVDAVMFEIRHGTGAAGDDANPLQPGVVQSSRRNIAGGYGSARR